MSTLLLGLKAFLSDRIEVALLALSLVANVTLFTFYVRARDAHVRTLETLVPLATRLSDMLSLAVQKARAKSRPPTTTSSSSGITLEHE